MQGQEQQIDVDNLTDEDWEELVAPVIIEAMLDGRLPCGDMEFSQLVEVGLELGLVVDCGKGDLQLSRDVEITEQITEQVGLALSQQAEEHGLELSNGEKHKGTWTGAAAGVGGALATHSAVGFGMRKSGLSGTLARGLGRAAAKAGDTQMGRILKAGVKNSGMKTIGGAVGKAIMKHPVAAGVGAAALGTGVAVKAGMSAKHTVDNMLTRNAESRNKK